MMQSTDNLSLVVSQVRELGPRIRVYELRNIAGDDLPLVSAGAHIEIQLTLADGGIGIRQYAICSNPAQREFYEILVLREELSRGGSDFIFNHFNVGTQVDCAFPTNHFHLHADSSPAILFACGIGIASIKTIAHTLALRGRRFTLHYLDNGQMSAAFIAELEAIFPRNFKSYVTNQDQPLDIMHLLADAPANAYIYACGPHEILADIETNARLLAIPRDRIQLYSFSLPRTNEDQDVLLELAYSNKLIKVSAQQSLLNAVREAGVNASFDCCIGDCGSCAVKVLEGEAEHRDHVLSDAQKAQGLMCLCVSRALGNKLVIAL